jgi:hypothetical protein
MATVAEFTVVEGFVPPWVPIGRLVFDPESRMFRGWNDEKTVLVEVEMDAYFAAQAPYRDLPQWWLNRTRESEAGA